MEEDAGGAEVSGVGVSITSVVCMSAALCRYFWYEHDDMWVTNMRVHLLNASGYILL